MIKFTKIQLRVIEAFFHRDMLNTSTFVKIILDNGEFSKSWVWENIHKLEREGLIERVNPCAYQLKRIKHRKLFTKESLADDYGICFINNKEDNILVEKEVPFSAEDLK